MPSQNTELDEYLRANSGPHESGCILWTGPINPHGYGHCSKRFGPTNLAHRLSFMASNGPLLKGLSICHKCDVRRCINPEHLFQGTHFDNIRDCVKKGRATRAKGEKAALSRLTEEKVREILESAEPRSVLAQRFSITSANVWFIQRRRTWRHVVVENPGPNTGPRAEPKSRPATSRKTKLTDDDVREILASDDTYMALAKRYGVVFSVIAWIKTGDSWRHIPRPTKAAA